MRPALELRWEFTPKDLFEDTFVTQQYGCEIMVALGTVVATIPNAALLNDTDLRLKIERYVAGLFLGAMLQAHTAYELSRPSVSTLHADGSRGVIIECETGHAECRGYPPDIRYTNVDGKIVDTRKNRVDHKRRLSELAAKLIYEDETLARMLRSYNNAVRDPADELIHLYEIRDCLTSHFGAKNTALAHLGLTNRDWSRLGHLCNVLPLKEGRHRGEAGDALRAASEEELSEARAIASSFIESYMQFGCRAV